MTLKIGAAFGALMLAVCGQASAHVTLEVQEAKAGSAYKAILRVPHGCDGAPTTKITVQVPEGFISAKPMPHAGWTIETVKGKYARAYDYFGSPLDEGLTEVSWSGGSLPDDYYDEFVLRGTFAAELPAGMIYFPVVQECEGGKAERWIEIPADGKAADDYESPAPGLMLEPKS
jgi:uncharacterized protein YcnI